MLTRSRYTVPPRAQPDQLGAGKRSKVLPSDPDVPWTSLQRASGSRVRRGRVGGCSLPIRMSAELSCSACPDRKQSASGGCFQAPIWTSATLDHSGSLRPHILITQFLLPDFAVSYGKHKVFFPGHFHGYRRSTDPSLFSHSEFEASAEYNVFKFNYSELHSVRVRRGRAPPSDPGFR